MLFIRRYIFMILKLTMKITVNIIVTSSFSNPNFEGSVLGHQFVYIFALFHFFYLQMNYVHFEHIRQYQLVIHLHENVRRGNIQFIYKYYNSNILFNIAFIWQNFHSLMPEFISCSKINKNDKNNDIKGKAKSLCKWYSPKCNYGKNCKHKC